jgi:aryl-alcohol dehydrogenase-like predicted oxidoreductase
MKYRQLADTGVFVSEVCLGTMTFGGVGQIWEVIGGIDQSTVDAIVHRSLDAGINFIDTAKRLLGRRVGDDDRQGAGRAPARGGARDEGARRAKFDFPPVDKEKGYAILDVLAEIAKARGATVPQVALEWILANDAVTSVIIGARKIAQLEDNLKAIDIALTPEDMKALDEASKLAVEYPAWMDALGSDRRPGERRY